MTKIVGFRHVDFKDKNGIPIVGDKIYVTDDSNEYVTGVSTDAVFLPKGKLNFDLALGQVVDIRYNKYGKIDTVSLISNAKEKF